MKRKDKILTEDDLLRDSADNYMSEEQLQFFKNKLESQANELLQNADETTEHLRKTSLVPDPADRASTFCVIANTPLPSFSCYGSCC